MVKNAKLIDLNTKFVYDVFNALAKDLLIDVYFLTVTLISLFCC